MRRGVLTSAAVALAMVCTVSVVAAAPGKRSYEGQVTLEPGSRLSFTLIKKKSGRKTVKNLSFQGVPASCAAGTVHSEITGGIPGSARVSKKKFELESTDPLQTLRFTGEVSHRGARAAGSLRFSGSFTVAGVALSCDTGPRGWAAGRA